MDDFPMDGMEETPRRRIPWLWIGLGGAGERSGQTGGFSGSGEVCNKDHESLSFPGFQTLGVFWDQTPGRSAASRVFCAITPTSAWGV